MFQNLDQFRAQVPFEHWLSRIAINTCLNQIKSEKSRAEVRWADLSAEQAEVLETLATKDDAVDSSHAVAARDLVERLLQCLAAPDRLLISLLYLDGHTGLEVQKITGWNHALIRIRAYRARTRLRKEYAKLMETHE